MNNTATIKTDWLESSHDISRQLGGKRVVRISDGYCSYYAELAAIATVDDAVDEFCSTYNYNAMGSEGALRKEISTHLWEKFPAIAENDPIPYSDDEVVS